MPAPTAPGPHGTSAGERVILGAIAIAGILAFAALLATAPAPAPQPVHWTRAIGGGLCFLAVAVAWTAGGVLRGPSKRWPFISEVLAAMWRRDRDAPATWGGFVGSLAANTLMLVGAGLFLLDAVWLTGDLQYAVVATSLALIGVVVRPLEDVAPRTAPIGAFVHPHFAALFYLCAVVLSFVERSQLGRIGQVLAALHIASSGSLIVLSVVASVLEYRWAKAMLPPSLGTRILLDTSPHSRARWVRRWQWPATIVVGLALALAAAGL